MVELIAEIEQTLLNIDAKIGQIRALKSGHTWGQDQVDKSVERCQLVLTAELIRQRQHLIDEINQHLRESLQSLSPATRFRPGYDCRHILNDVSHLIGSISIANPFSLFKKFVYFNLLDQFRGEIRLRDDHSPSIRILALVNLNRLFVYLSQIDDSGRSFTGYFKIFNMKWDELSSIRVGRELGRYKNLLALEDGRRAAIVCLFSESENGSHWIRVYDERLDLVKTREFNFNLKLVSVITESGEIVCWRGDINRILFFNLKSDYLIDFGPLRTNI